MVSLLIGESLIGGSEGRHLLSSKMGRGLSWLHDFEAKWQEVCWPALLPSNFFFPGFHWFSVRTLGRPGQVYCQGVGLLLTSLDSESGGRATK